MIKISFLGDISLNDDYIRLYKEGINPFASLESILKTSDFVIGNLECMVIGNEGENLLKAPRLSTTAETLNYLKNINLKVANLANNHVYDHLKNGFTETTNFLENNEIRYLGAGLSKNDAEKHLILKKNDLEIGLLNYVTEDTHPNMPNDARVFLNIFDIERAKKDICKLRSSVDYVVIIMHWGGKVEGGLFPDYIQPVTARKLVDIGADLVIGHHSHTVQPYEAYKNKYIFYSLGNFCFSDYTFNGIFHPMPKRRKITEIVNVNFEKNGYTVFINYFLNELINFKEHSYQSYQKLINIIFKYIMKYKFFWNLYYMHFLYILPLYHFLIRKDMNINRKANRLILALKKRIS